jgi:DNA ligase-associated metallophosphoesterase
VSGATQLEIAWGGERLHLLGGRGIFWPAGRTLFIADPHFGKSATFRSLGIAAPDETQNDLARLDSLLEAFEPSRLVVLGDFFHARAGRSNSMVDALITWRNSRLVSALEIVIVRGNHDRNAGDPPADWRMHCAPERWVLGPFNCCHYPRHEAGAYVLAGHIHPGFSLRDGYGVGMSMACFVVEPRTLILPAFGSFTGLERVTPGPKTRIFGVNSGEIMEIPVDARGRLNAFQAKPVQRMNLQD